VVAIGRGWACAKQKKLVRFSPMKQQGRASAQQCPLLPTNLYAEASMSPIGYCAVLASMQTPLVRQLCDA